MGEQTVAVHMAGLSHRMDVLLRVMEAIKVAAFQSAGQGQLQYPKIGEYKKWKVSFFHRMLTSFGKKLVTL